MEWIPSGVCRYHHHHHNLVTTIIIIHIFWTLIFTAVLEVMQHSGEWPLFWIWLKSMTVRRISAAKYRIWDQLTGEWPGVDIARSAGLGPGCHLFSSGLGNLHSIRSHFSGAKKLLKIFKDPPKVYWILLQESLRFKWIFDQYWLAKSPLQQCLKLLYIMQNYIKASLEL